MAARNASPALLALALFATACASGPEPVPEPDAKVAAAEAQLARGDAAGVVAALAEFEREGLPRRLRDRYDLTLGSAWVALGERWTAFEALENFADDHPLSDLRPAVAELLWEIGRQLAASDGGFLFFWSDRRAGRTVLEHLITRHPDCPRLADALRLLGDLAYEDADYDLAQERFRDLIRRRPESEWALYARYRFAMSIVASLQGPDYDLDQMELAERELTAFLDPPPENPELVGNARRELAKLLAWQAERHLAIARFYRRVGNADGQRQHLAIAAQAKFAGTPAHGEATAELTALGPAPAKAGGQ